MIQKEVKKIRTVIFDMYETLVTMYGCPPYFGADIAADIGIEESVFRQLWDSSDEERTLGHKSFAEVVKESMILNNRYSDELYKKIIDKRTNVQFEYFRHLHPEIIPMLDSLRSMDIRLALISNCYFEERDAIRQSNLWNYFDTACLSCEVHLKKPDERIYKLCLDGLGLSADECLYVGDGGSNELEAAVGVGMHAVQAAWYSHQNTSCRKAMNKHDISNSSDDLKISKILKFDKLTSPIDVIEKVKGLT